MRYPCRWFSAVAVASTELVFKIVMYLAMLAKWLSRRHSVKIINNSSQLRSFVQKSECVDRIWKINLVWKKSLWGKKYFSFCINNGIGCVGDKEPERKIYVLSYPFCGYMNLLVLFKIFRGLKLLTINSPPAYDNRKVG